MECQEQCGGVLRRGIRHQSQSHAARVLKGPKALRASRPFSRLSQRFCKCRLGPLKDQMNAFFSDVMNWMPFITFRLSRSSLVMKRSTCAAAAQLN